MHSAPHLHIPIDSQRGSGVGLHGRDESCRLSGAVVDAADGCFESGVDLAAVVGRRHGGNEYHLQSPGVDKGRRSNHQRPVRIGPIGGLEVVAGRLPIPFPIRAANARTPRRA